MNTIGQTEYFTRAYEHGILRYVKSDITVNKIIAYGMKWASWNSKLKIWKWKKEINVNISVGIFVFWICRRSYKMIFSPTQPNNHIWQRIYGYLHSSVSKLRKINIKVALRYTTKKQYHRKVNGIQQYLRLRIDHWAICRPTSLTRRQSNHIYLVTM